MGYMTSALRASSSSLIPTPVTPPAPPSLLRDTRPTTGTGPLADSRARPSRCPRTSWFPSRCSIAGCTTCAVRSEFKHRAAGRVITIDTGVAAAVGGAVEVSVGGQHEPAARLSAARAAGQRAKRVHRGERTSGSNLKNRTYSAAGRPVEITVEALDQSPSKGRRARRVVKIVQAGECLRPRDGRRHGSERTPERSFSTVSICA